MACVAALIYHRQAMPGSRFLVSCVHCLRPIVLAERIRDPELSQLRQHVSDLHPDKITDSLPGIEATLRHFRVEPEPGPPDAACNGSTTPE